MEWRRVKNTGWLVLLLAEVVVSFQPAFANAGLPMLAVVWPGSWGLLLIIIPIEAFIASRMLQTDSRKSLKLAALCNLVSTLLGIPVTWIGLVVLQMYVGRMANVDFSPVGKISFLIGNSAWLGVSYGSPVWEIPAAAACLCIPFFLMSVGIEYLTARGYLDDQIDKSAILRWSWMANGITYGLITLLLVISAEVFAYLQVKL